MLRPERMSKVSVTGSKSVMRDTIEAIHGLNLLHLSDYDDRWEGFRTGDPVEGAEQVSDKLVTIRSIESILDIEPEDAGPSRIVTEEALDEELEEVRTEVNRLDDRRSELRDELRSVRDRLDAMRPFATLGIDLDLLSGYDTIEVRVGEGRSDAVESELAAADGISAYETFSEGNVVAVFARADPETLDEALVGADFTVLEIPDAEGSPESYEEELRHERQRLDSKLDGVENELENLKLETAGFLLAAEETLSIDVQKREAPLQFATTEHSFIAEGWIPTARYDELATTLQREIGDHVSVEELERAEYHEGHHAHGGEMVTDGGHAHEREQPPVVQDNPDPAKPFELLVEVINRPKYFELDPTVVLFLTFPAFFGFMIGDLGYGILYTAIGWGLYKKFDSAAIRSLGGIAMWAGLFTMLFGVLYGEIFGFHVLGEFVWDGHPPLEKGLSPATIEYAQAWLVLSLLLGLLHLNVGYAFDFVERLDHGVRDAFMESASWILLMDGVWLWIFSTHMADKKPEFLFTAFAGDPYSLGFAGFSPAVGYLGLAIAAVGLAALIAAERIVGALESLNVLVNVLSYTRIAAVLLAKAGMAFVVNLLVFGAYVHHGEFHFLTGHGPEWAASQYGAEAIMFPGLFHSGIAGILAGLLILVIGHLLVLALGITSAGLQAVRLEYVEFFGKFYDGGGEKYEPFGYDRAYTTED